MDDTKPTSTEDEFHFSEAEESTSYASVADSREGKKSGKLTRRNLLIAIVVIVVAFSLYKLTGVFFGSSGTQKRTPTVITTPHKIKSISQATVIKAPTQLSVKPAATALSSSLLHQFSQMEEYQVQSRQQVDSISNTLSSLSNSIENLQGSVAAINQQLQTISSQLQRQHAAIRALRPKKVKRTKRRTVPIRSTWYIQALVPGRAWLFQTNGKNITARVGDLLAGYGRVKDISIIKGVVKMSSGVIIRYRGL